MSSEIVEQLFIDNELESTKIELYIKLNKRNLNLLKELHGNIGLDEFSKELSEEIKTTLNDNI